MGLPEDSDDVVTPVKKPEETAEIEEGKSTERTEG